MNISWFGGSSVELSLKKNRVLLNPTSKADLNHVSMLLYDRTDEKRKTSEEVVVIDWPGEYDRAGFVFRGLEFFQKPPVISYVFHTQEGNIAWLGEMKEYPSEEFIESLGEVHVLILPVGDKDVLSAKDAFKLVEELEPLVVIPMCYGGNRDGLSEFLKELDVKMPTPQRSYELKKSALNTENMELVILEELKE